MSSIGRKIAAKPLDFAPGRPAITPVDSKPNAEPIPAVEAGIASNQTPAAALKGVVVYLQPAEAIALKVYAAQNSTSIQQLGTEAFAELFRRRGINGGVLTRVRANRKHGGNR